MALKTQIRLEVSRSRQARPGKPDAKLEAKRYSLQTGCHKKHGTACPQQGRLGLDENGCLPNKRKETMSNRANHDPTTFWSGRLENADTVSRLGQTSYPRSVHVARSARPTADCICQSCPTRLCLRHLTYLLPQSLYYGICKLKGTETAALSPIGEKENRDWVAAPAAPKAVSVGCSALESTPDSLAAGRPSRPAAQRPSSLEILLRLSSIRSHRCPGSQPVNLIPPLSLFANKCSPAHLQP